MSCRILVNGVMVEPSEPLVFLRLIKPWLDCAPGSVVGVFADQAQSLIASGVAKQEDLEDVAEHLPIAWALVRPEDGKPISAFVDYESASRERLKVSRETGFQCDLVGLARRRQSLLSAQECEAIHEALQYWENAGDSPGPSDQWVSHTLRNLLARA